MHGTEAPSPWVCRWSHLLPTASTALDVACGAGRHIRWLHAQGHSVVGIDQSAEALAVCDGLGELICADIENAPWPLPGRQFGGIVVTNYLHRPLLPTLLDNLSPEGVLLYETFAQGQETVGRPSRPAFLLEPGELLRLCQGLRIVAFEDGFEPTEPDTGRFVQRIAAVRPASQQPAPPRYLLPAYR